MVGELWAAETEALYILHYVDSQNNRSVINQIAASQKIDISAVFVVEQSVKPKHYLIIFIIKIKCNKDIWSEVTFLHTHIYTVSIFCILL